MQAREKMLIICFLRRVSEPIAALLAAFLSEEEAKRVDVVLLDSARGLTADRVHVIYSSRFVGRYDQFLGIQADPSRLYVAYTRGRLVSGWSGNHSASQMKNVGKIGCHTDNNHPAKSASSRTTRAMDLSLQVGDLRFCIGGKLQNLLGRRIAHPPSFITGGSAEAQEAHEEPDIHLGGASWNHERRLRSVLARMSASVPI